MVNHMIFAGGPWRFKMTSSCECIEAASLHAAMSELINEVDETNKLVVSMARSLGTAEQEALKQSQADSFWADSSCV